MRADLEALRNRSEAELGGDGAAIPFHERGADLENLFAIHTDNLGDLSRVIGDRQIEFLARSDIHFAENAALSHDRQAAVNRGAGDGIVDHAGVIKELLGGEVFFLLKSGVVDREPLIGHAQPLLGQVLAILFTGGVVAHGETV